MISADMRIALRRSEPAVVTATMHARIRGGKMRARELTAGAALDCQDAATAAAGSPTICAGFTMRSKSSAWM